MNFYQKILPSLRYHNALSSDISIISDINVTTNLINECTLVETVNFYDIAVLERNESNLYRFNGKINFFYSFDLIGFGSQSDSSLISYECENPSLEEICENAVDGFVCNDGEVNITYLDEEEMSVQSTISLADIDESNGKLLTTCNGNPSVCDQYVIYIEEILTNMFSPGSDYYNVCYDGANGGFSNDRLTSVGVNYNDENMVTLTQTSPVEISGFPNGTPSASNIEFLGDGNNIFDGNKIISGYEYDRNWIMQLTYPISILRNQPWRENPQYCYENGLLIESVEKFTDGGLRIEVCTCSDHNLASDDIVYINNPYLRGFYDVIKVGDKNKDNIYKCFIVNDKRIYRMGGNQLQLTEPDSDYTYQFNGTIKRVVNSTTHNNNRFGYKPNIELVFPIHYDTFTGNTCVGEYCGKRYYPKWQHAEGEYYTNSLTPKWWTNWDTDRGFIAFCVPEGHGLLRGDYVEILNASGCTKLNGLHRVKYLGLPYTFNDGNCKLSGEDYFFNDKVFVIDMDFDLNTCGFNPSELLWRKIDGCASEYYLREFEIVGTVDDYEVFRNGFEKTIYDKLNVQFQFNKTFDFTDKLDYLNRPLTEVYIGFIKVPGEAPYPWTSVDGELDFRVCVKDNSQPIALRGGISNYLNYDSGENPITGVTQSEAQWVFTGNTSINKIRSIGSKYIGDLLEYNVCDLSETVIAPIIHRFNDGHRNWQTNPLNTDPQPEPSYNLNDLIFDMTAIESNENSFTFEYTFTDDSATISNIIINSAAIGLSNEPTDVEYYIQVNDEEPIIRTDFGATDSDNLFVYQILLNLGVSEDDSIQVFISANTSVLITAKLLLTNRVRTYSYDEGFKYKPFHRIEIKSLSEYIEYANFGTDVKQEVPSWAECYLNNFQWRDILDPGTRKLEERFVDYPFTNGVHYIYKNYNLFLQRECADNTYEEYCSLDYDKFRVKDVDDEC